MTNIIISKKQYQELLDKALRYEYLRSIMEENIFAPPPTKDIKKIIRAFEKTGIYSKEFLRSLKKGLRRSSYFKNENSPSSSRN
jgi:hypothetical protein